MVNGGATREEAEASLTTLLICDQDAAVISQPDVPDVTQQAMTAYAAANGLSSGVCLNDDPEAPHFGHMWAVAGSHTVGGSAALVGEPRIAVQAPNHLYEFGISGHTFAVTGAGVPGSPNVLVGHAKNVAWSVTALGMDQGDLFYITTDDANHPGQYEYDGEFIDYDVDESEDLLLKDPNGCSPTVLETIQYRETVWGPVVTATTNGADTGQEYTAHMVPLFQSGLDCSRGMLDMARATDVQSMYAATEGWIYPSANMVFAGSAGAIGYTVVGTYPVRNPALPLARRMAGNGSVSASQWIDLLPMNVRPHVFNPEVGYLFSGNHIPIGNWYPIPTPWGAHGDTLRSKRLREKFSSQLFPMAVNEVFRYHADTVNSARRNFATVGIWLRDNQSSYQLSDDAVSALTHLELWLADGATMDNNHYGTAFADNLDLMFRGSNAGQPAIEFGDGEAGLVLFFDAMLAKISATPSEDLTVPQADYINQVLEDAYTGTMAAAGTPDLWQVWYDTNKLMVSIETWKSLEKAPSLNPGNFVTAVLPTVDNATILSSPTQTFTQMVDLGLIDGGLTTMPPGNSENGDNFDSQHVLWGTGAVKQAPITIQGLNGAGITSSIVIQY